MSTIDKHLLEIQPPSCIAHKPCAISKHMKYCKASEFKSFLLYYSLPLLTGILPQYYWDHHALLVVAICTLLQQPVSPHQLDLCQTLLTKYCYHFSNFYVNYHMTANVHLLLHLPDTATTGSAVGIFMLLIWRSEWHSKEFSTRYSAIWQANNIYIFIYKELAIGCNQFSWQNLWAGCRCFWALLAWSSPCATSASNSVSVTLFLVGLPSRYTFSRTLRCCSGIVCLV